MNISVQIDLLEVLVYMCHFYVFFFRTIEYVSKKRYKYLYFIFLMKTSILRLYTKKRYKYLSMADNHVQLYNYSRGNIQNNFHVSNQN